MKNTDIIKDKLNILDVVSSYVKLEKAGKTYKGKSPFTNEKTPSFFVSPEKGFFYCFSSQKGGDMFTFIEEIEQVDFKTALALLAEKAGVDLQYRASEKNDKKELYREILERATKWYEVQLRKNTEVVNYLRARGLSKETIIKFRIGYAPPGWQHIYDYLVSKKYHPKDIEAAGLCTQKTTGSYYDRFRSRIMFPIRDPQGRVVGFSGRIFPENKNEKAAKYVNSPESILFNKSELLFGYHLAKHEIHRHEASLVVEGQFDVILCQQAGYGNTVALSGTGLSPDQLNLLKRFSDTLILALDADKAGIKATRKSVLAAYEKGMEVKIVSLPLGQDPADVILKSKEQFDLLIHEASDYIDYRLAHTGQDTEMSFQQKKSFVEKDLFEIVFLNQSAIAQDRMLQKIALFLGVSTEAVRNDFNSYQPEHRTDLEPQNDSPSPDESNESKHPKKNLLDILYLGHFIYEQGCEISKEETEKITTLYRDIYQSDFHEDLKKVDETEKNIQLFKLQEEYRDVSHSGLKNKFITALVLERKRQLDQQSQDLLKRIRQAEIQKDEALRDKLSKENHRLRILSDQLEE